MRLKIKKENTLKNKEVLITGGTGSLGKVVARKLLQLGVRGIRVYSRDEYKQWQMRKEFGSEKISYLIGDIRDQGRLEMAMKGVDIVINTAAMKQVSACEENPVEAIKTNVIGSTSVIEAAIANNVQKVMHISTDKAVYPVNLYGMTKGCAEKLFINANIYSPHSTRFSCCRYGNVVGSRGSVIPLFRKQAKTGLLKVTDLSMTRFWIKLDQVGDFIIDRINEMEGGEIFVPQMPSAKITDIAKAIAPDCTTQVIGIRDGEKLHEVLLTEEESVFADLIMTNKINYYKIGTEKTRTSRFSYDSGDNTLLNVEQIKDIINNTKIYDMD